MKELSGWVKSLSHVPLFATPWTVAHQAPPSTGFSRQEYWSGLPFPSPEDLSEPGIEPRSPTLQADTLTSEPPGKLAWVNKFSSFIYIYVYVCVCVCINPLDHNCRYWLRENFIEKNWYYGQNLVKTQKHTKRVINVRKKQLIYVTYMCMGTSFSFNTIKMPTWNKLQWTGWNSCLLLIHGHIRVSLWSIRQL